MNVFIEVGFVSSIGLFIREADMICDNVAIVLLAD
jgi:hypothetical protein